jgi:hypothetical protein
VALLRVSAAHVYLTYPFVLSWSMLEAMSAGCLVIGSATPPVEEVIRDGDNGLLVDFFSPPAIAEAVDRVLSHRDRMADVRRRARETVIERYDLRGVCLPRHIALVDAVASGRPPPDAGAEIAGSARPARVSLSLTPTLSRRRERVALHEQAQPIDPSPVRPSRAGEGADRQLAPPNPLPSGEGASEASG